MATTPKTRRTTKKAEAHEEAPAVPEAAETPDAPEDISKYPLMSRPADDASLALKLAYIMGEIGNRQAVGENKHFSYKYFTDKQLSGIFQNRFASMGIIVVPHVLDSSVIERSTSKGGASYLTSLKIRFEIIDGHTGQIIMGVGFGQGDDPGDKGSNKAFTGALKYFLIKLFNIGGEADAEADTETDQRSTTPERPTQIREQRGPARAERSTTGPVARGGRQAKGTEAQLMKIRELGVGLKMGAQSIAQVVRNVLKVEIELDTESPAPSLRQFLESLDADDLGKIVTALQIAVDRAKSLDEDFAKAEAMIAHVAAEGEQEPPPSDG